MVSGSGFYEPDEPADEVLAALGRADKGVTAPHLPPGATLVTVSGNTVLPGHLSADDCVSAMWDICEDDDGPDIRARCDQWWGVIVTCVHGRYRGTSRGQVDVTSAFRNALEHMKEEHP